MGVEIKPLGVKCNINCQYCYQNPIRDNAPESPSYDLAKIKAAVEADGRPFSLFGGEPLLMRRADLEDLWAWGLARFGKNGVQTNGTLIDADFIRMFKAYRVHVGISVDGPGALNDARWAGTLAATRRQTLRTENAIAQLCLEKIPPSLIVTLSRTNASPDQLPLLLEWFERLAEIGVRHVRLHALESESDAVRAHYALSPRENVEAFLEIHRRRPRKLKFDVFIDMRNMLLGQDGKAACVWMNCDPYTTQAVSGVEGNGQRSNCARTNKDGVDYVKSNRVGFERYLALYLTPQKAGGCKDCRFFLMCKGQCPGTAIAGDWRNRTEHCELWTELFSRLEEELLAAGKTPISTDPRRTAIEHAFLGAWARGENMSMSSQRETQRG